MGRMPPDALPTLLLFGPAGHGVVDYGADVAARVRAGHPAVTVRRVGSAAEALADVDASEAVHLHVTDRLLGSSPEEAASLVEQFGTATRLTVTLHDLPQPSDGAMMARRVAAYARMIAAADGVVVNSSHEQRLIVEHLPHPVVPTVIPLGARSESTPRTSSATPRGDERPAGRDLTVMIAGFVYPGKGHAEAIDAAADAVGALRAAGESVGEGEVRALGAVSAGHDTEMRELEHRARGRGVRWHISGFLDDATFARAMRGRGVPVAAHQHVSASRSMLDWVEAGRRPLVAHSRYAAEMDRLRPDTTILFAAPDLAAMLVAAWRDPASTWLAPGTDLRPSLTDAAEAYVRFWNRAQRP